MNTGYTKEVMQNAPPINFSLANATRSDVTFTLTQNQLSVKEQEVDEIGIRNSEIDVHIPTIILIHGWSDYERNPWYGSYIKKYFQVKKCNIICVNWSAASTKSFLVSSANTKLIGGYIGEFIIASGIPAKNIHIISHSLGCHTAGFAGKLLIKRSIGKLQRITALDPAAPTIDNKFVSEAFRLSSNDADFVDVYHTDAGFFGFTKPIGHVDFYPNFGRDQPGCPDHKTDESANHIRAVKYFEETINKPCYFAYPANITLNGYDYILDVNYEGERIIIGDLTPLNAKGIFYFKTKDREPFLLEN